MERSSKEVKITIVLDNGKTTRLSEGKKEHSVTVTHDSSMTLMSTLLKNGLLEGSFCGGRGDCGRCRVQFIEGVMIPTMLERSVMTADELRQGYRLACLARPKDDCVIRLAFAEEKKIAIISNMIDMPENNDRLSQQNVQSINQTTSVSSTDVMKESAATDTDVIEKKPNSEQKAAPERITAVTEGLIAVDLGTTTIAMQLMEVNNGRILDTYCAMNPQRRYGSDVLSRIRASCDGHREELRQLVVSVLKEGVMQFEKSSTAIRGMCIAGNTTMTHLLMGYDVLSLGSSPFTPVDIGLQVYKDPAWDFTVWIAPGISAFVGGDIVAGLYALKMLPDDRRIDCYGQCESLALGEEDTDLSTRLLIDLGTNGEMAITDGRRMIVTAAAAGPAFEGGAGAGIVGSDMIANAAELLERGILDETGLLEEPWFTEGICTGEPAVRLYNKDIRDLQMAKAAVRAGVEILWKKMGQPRIRQVYLAGGFGYYLDVEAAFRIGLLPVSMRGRVTAAGNTSLAGAYHIGRDLLSGSVDKETLENRLSFIESINLAEQGEFETLYVKYMDFR